MRASALLLAGSVLALAAVLLVRSNGDGRGEVAAPPGARAVPRAHDALALAVPGEGDALGARAANEDAPASPAEGPSTTDLEAPGPGDRPLRHLSLRARAVDPEGRAVAGAALALERAPAAPLATSTGDGTLSVERDLPGDETLLSWGPGMTRVLRMVLAKEGFVPVSRALSLDGGTVFAGDLVLVPGAPVAGTLLDGAGRPVPRGRVALFPAAAAPVEGTPVGSGALAAEALVPTGTDGSFALPGLREGTWVAVGVTDELPRAMVGGPPTAPFEVRAGVPVEGLVVRLSAALEAGRLEVPRDVRGRVLHADGSPAGGARVRLDVVDGSQGPQGAVADAEGGFLFPAVALARDRVSLVAIPSEGFDAPAEASAVDPVDEVVLRLGPPRPFRLRVVDGDGRALPWSNVRVQAEDPYYSGLPAGAGGSPFGGLVALGAEGERSLPLPVGAFSIEAFAPAFERRRLGPVDPGTVQGALDVVLERGGVVSGRVVHEGSPVAGALVGLAYARRDGGWTTGRIAGLHGEPFAVHAFVRGTEHDATTDADGRFVISTPGDGWRVAVVRAPGFGQAVFGPWELHGSGDVDGLELALRSPGSLAGTVRLGPDTTPEEVLVVASDGSGLALTAPLDPSGRYRLDRLAPGPWQVRAATPPLPARVPIDIAAVLAAGVETSEPIWDVEVPSGATARLDLDLADMGAFVLAGRVELGTQAEDASFPTQGYVARATPVGSVGQGATAPLDASGRFVLPLDGPGPFELVVSGRLRGIGGPKALPPPLTLQTTLTLARGRNEWSAAVPVGWLDLSLPEDRTNELRAETHLGDGVLARVDPIPWTLALGRATAALGYTDADPPADPVRIPVAAGHVTLLDRQPRGDDAAPRALVEVDLAPGATVPVRLP